MNLNRQSITSQISPKEKLAKFAMCIIALVWLGYPIQASIPIILNADTRPFNFGFRLLYAVISLLVIFKFYLSRKTLTFTKGSAIIAFFWLFYSIRLIYDNSILGIQFLDGPSYVYSFAFGNTLLPLVAIITITKYLNYKYVFKVLYIVIATSSIVILVLILYQNKGLSVTLFSGRVSITQDDTKLVISTLWVGFFGSILGVTTLLKLIFLKLSIWEKLISMLLLIIAILNVFLGASRSPFFTLVILASLSILLSLYFSVKKGRIPVKTLSIFTLIFIALSFGISQFRNIDFAMVERLTKFSEAREIDEKEERDYEWESAWNQFQSSPVWGDKFITDYDDYYPHNIHLEVLMSLGLLGGIPYLLIYLGLFKRLKKSISNHNIYAIFLFFIFANVVFFSSTSGALYADTASWGLLGLLLNNLKK